MSDPEAAASEALRWLRFSGDDLDVAQHLLTSLPSAPRHVCSLSQQAAEKALKAALVLEGADFPFSHDLDALRNLLPPGWPVRTEHPDLAELTEWAVERDTLATGRNRMTPTQRARRLRPARSTIP